MADRKKSVPARAQVDALYSYDPQTGFFRWKISRGIGRKGAIAGSPTGRGYLRLNIAGERFLAHLVAWFLMTGEWPAHKVDHKDTDGTNNRWNNLREATQAQNLANKKISSLNKCGFKGVCADKRRGNFKAEIQKDRIKIFLGYFATAAEAHAAYAAASGKVHGEFARVK